MRGKAAAAAESEAAESEATESGQQVDGVDVLADRPASWGACREAVRAHGAHVPLDCTLAC